jgi:hypothetical protein
VKILYLPIKKKWFDMIASGEKKEEYRKCKPYWDKRLRTSPDVVCLRNGYGKNAPTMYFKITSIARSFGIIEWGAPEKENVYIIRLGERINPK